MTKLGCEFQYISKLLSRVIQRVKRLCKPGRTVAPLAGKLFLWDSKQC